jgi:NAD-specific glutamate dehydrogenase
MISDTDKLLLSTVREALGKGFSEACSRYDSSLRKLAEQVVEANHAELGSLLHEAIKTCVQDETFREEIKSAVRSHLAKLLVQRFGGELEKQVNTLKSDPATRARVVVALDEIVNPKT